MSAFRLSAYVHPGERRPAMSWLSLASEVLLPAVQASVGCSIQNVMVVCAEGVCLGVSVLDETFEGTVDHDALALEICIAMSAHSDLPICIGQPLADDGTTVSFELLSEEGRICVRVSQ